MTDLLALENNLIQKGFKLIAGMDEAGRGPLAGPVTCVCVIPDLTKIFNDVNDSKKISANKREKLFDILIENCISYSVIDIDNAIIDEINILNATKEGMKKAADSLSIKPDYLLVDAVKLDLELPYEPIIHGDALSYSIAYASIIAKVHRDELMRFYAEKYPEYGFEKHKGYGTALHIEMLKKYGPCPIHRKTFIKNFFN